MKSKTEQSRRNLLKSAAFAGGAVMVIGPQLTVAGEKKTKPPELEDRPLSDFEEVLRRCGSEFGDVVDAG
jgi:hypothetical protein